jgi:UDP-GlcNAc3NAcA epimerase
MGYVGPSGKMLNVLTVVGTRPQYIKAAAVSKTIAAHPNITETIVDTGQHFDYEMSEIFVRQLGLPAPALNLGINSKSHGRMTGEMIIRIEEILLERTPDMLLVYGDTNSTLAAAIAASKIGIPIAHVEGGVRLGVWNPEEINRRLVDAISDLIFCATPAAVQSLATEGIREGVHFTGDTMLDMAMMVPALAAGHLSKNMELGLARAGYVAMTIHRAENTSDPAHFRRIIDYIITEADGRRIIFPAHPRSVKFCRDNDISLGPIEVIKPLGYIDMAIMVANAAALFTDSGGLQKEAFFHRVPCTLIYEESPWPETIQAGWNRLWTVKDFLPRGDTDAFGDGTAARQIVDLMYSYWLATESRPVSRGGAKSGRTH